MFTFEIDSENALVGCTLERWRPGVELAKEIGNFRRLIWNPVHLVQGSTWRYVLVRTSTYLTRYMVVRETSKWYIPVRTNIGNSYNSTYQYILVCTYLYLHSTRWYKTVHGSTGRYMEEQWTVQGGTWRYETVHTGTYQNVPSCTAWCHLVQGGTWRYRKGHSGTLNGTRRYMRVQACTRIV